MKINGVSIALPTPLPLVELLISRDIQPHELLWKKMGRSSRNQLMKNNDDC